MGSNEYDGRDELLFSCPVSYVMENALEKLECSRASHSRKDL